MSSESGTDRDASDLIQPLSDSACQVCRSKTRKLLHAGRVRRAAARLHSETRSLIEHFPDISPSKLASLRDWAQSVQQVLDTRRPVRLNKRQRHLYEFIADHIASHGFSPTVKEMCDVTGWERRRVYEALGSIARRGWIANHERPGDRQIELLPTDDPDPVQAENDRLRTENRRLRVALADAIRRPLGVVPVSAEGLTEPEQLPGWYRGMESSNVDTEHPA